MTTATRVRPADAAGVADAVARLVRGEVVALPTETVYGLAADACQAAAVARIFAAKGRPPDNPLIVHVADMAMARGLARWSPEAARLAQAFWPGPLTLVLPRAAGAPLVPAVTAGLPTVALRAPDHPVTQAVIQELGRAIAAPSANRSGRLSPTRAQHVDLPGVPLVLDGGPCRLGLESTIVRPEADRLVLLRPGALPPEALAKVSGLPVVPAGPAARAEAPGMHHRHYAPTLPLDLDVTEPAPGRFWIGFGALAGDFNLSPRGDPEEAARHLFDALHAAERSGARRIGVAPIPAEGLGLAIRDRLRRAAAAAAWRSSDRSP
ncbi:MAG: L-threonylcarbamoyladenylate synthase [Sphingomonadaceae bacterium]|uniref:L-threonylcarbamoyladenylate synthase n=1 Tax=Thermaurantiacus sp. TaxID=2820283 RepID=UPI00298EF49A|nr:L-threonylcarbamoyladenylate synthase [Thermaurantiacus sp.]MCS6986767.1 L-threonylcarbamoyladenylate synthase [Sphingomonadaceae bacterium]MDW8413970.1 L-threonylcarbamoyladenylate synthase [Thermaurantiacus sp.]